MSLEDDIVYLARIYDEPVKKIYESIKNTSKQNEAFGLDSKVLAKILAETAKDIYSGKISPGFLLPNEVHMLDYLPDDSISEILLKIDPEEVLNFCHVSKKILKICNDSIFQHKYMAIHGTLPRAPFNTTMLNIMKFPHEFTIMKYKNNKFGGFGRYIKDDGSGKEIFNYKNYDSQIESRYSIEKNGEIKITISDITILIIYKLSKILWPMTKGSTTTSSSLPIPPPELSEYVLEDGKITITKNGAAVDIKVLDKYPIYSVMKNRPNLVLDFIMYDLYLKDIVNYNKIIKNLSSNIKTHIEYCFHKHNPNKPWDDDAWNEVVVK